MSGLLNKAKDALQSNSNSGSTDSANTGATGSTDASTTGSTGASGMEGKIDSGLNSELTKEGVPAQYDQKIDGVVNKEIGGL